MSQVEMPAYLKDADQLLSDNGFTVGDVWYHGTSSGLVPSIQANGLKRSGDQESNQAIKKTMATIGNTYTETIEPVFLTQSRQLAYYWAQRKSQFRSQRLGQPETPVVLQLSLNAELNGQVRPDAGGAGLIIARDAYIDYVEAVYEDSGKKLGELNPMEMDGKACLAKLGLAYLDKNIPAECVAIVTE